MLPRGSIRAQSPGWMLTEEKIKFPGLKITVAYFRSSKEHESKQDPRAQQGFHESPMRGW